MRILFTFLLAIIASGLVAQSTGDTIVVPTFNYSQTSGSGIRDTMIDFPDVQGQTYEKIIMLYNMRCKDGLISVPGNTNRGCGEWDYSCNTYITDSSRVDSVLSFTNSHTVSAFTGTEFNYVETEIYDYYQYRQKEVVLNNTTSETLSTVADGTAQIAHPLFTTQNSGKSQYLYTQSELTAAGLTAGDVDALILEVTTNTSDAEYMHVRIKHTTKTELSASDPDVDDFTEVYFHDYNFVTGMNRIQFHTPFVWDGSSNIIVEFSFTNNNNSSAIHIAGEGTTEITGIYSVNAYNLNSVNGKIELPTTAFSTISEELTISFWSKGNSAIQPIHNSILHGVDENNNRQVNLHLPWGNSKIYFDCGNDGSGYDRIEKSATAEEIKGNWYNWTIAKNATTGDMKIYKNGDLWHSGSSKTRLIDIEEFVIATSGGANRSYFGNIDDFVIWDVELDQQTIQDYVYRKVDGGHPFYGNMVAFYNLDEGSGSTVHDVSTHLETATIEDYLYWTYERGININRGFSQVPQRPTITFAQGSYDITVTDQIVTDSVLLTPSIVREFNIIPRWGTMLHDSINQLSVNEYWESQYSHIYNPEGVAIDSTFINHTGNIEITEMSYFKRFPSKYEIMSFVTPYGIYLDLGMDGKTWAFDVTDYTPILQGRKRMTIERGGQRQEDMDIKFMYIVGTPPQDVIDINQIWRPDSKSYTSIQADRSFEPRDFYFNNLGDMFKFRSVITGHGQQGEFSGRYHTLNIDGGDIEYEWRVWTECAENPIYPQGGTWIYDRAGWCPGAPSSLWEYDITEFVGAGQTHNLDYGLVYASGTSNYIINNQLVTYGAPNFNLDAAIIDILKPNSDEASATRFNPACSYPEIVVKNTGSTTITKVKIDYHIDGGVTESHTWYGTLEFLEKDTIVLPIDDLTFWASGTNVFNVEIIDVNDETDEYSFNNTYSANFEDLYVFPDGNYYTVQLKTNNYGFQTSYTLKDGNGTLLYERHNCDDNTLYEDEFYLFPGCYELRIDDTGDNGLEFWAQPQQGIGFFKIVNADGIPLYTFEPDFGDNATFEFGIGQITDINDTPELFSLNVFPNPVSEILEVQINGNGEESVNITLSNSISAVVYNKQWFTSSKATDIEIDMTNLTNGVYFLTVQYGEKAITKKVVKF